MARDYAQANFRIPIELKAALERAAEQNHRSLTAEIVSRLEDSFPKVQTDMFAELGTLHTRRGSTPLIPSWAIQRHLDEEFVAELRESFEKAMQAAYEFSLRIKSEDEAN